MQLMKSHKLSIIIPHYNSSDLLEKLLSTIPKNKNIEIMVIDDKSDITHINYILNLQEVFDFIFLRNYTDIKSAGTCRNIALSHATGKWVMFADADDYFIDNFYDSVSKFFDSANDVVFFMSTSIYLDTGEEAKRHIPFNNILKKYINDQSLNNELALRYSIPNPICKMIRKKFILENNIKFDEVIASNDVMFSTKVGFYMRKFEISESVLYVITTNFGSLTVNMNEKIFTTRLKVKIKYYNFLQTNLTKKQFNIMNLSFSGWLFSSFAYGISGVIKTFLLLKKEKVKILDKRMFNIKFIFKKLFDRYEKNQQNKKYYVKH